MTEKKPYSKPEITKEELRKMLVETNEKLYAANERLLHQEKERTEFFANLSHDLRASLSVVRGGIELLRAEREEGEENSEILKMLEARTAFMQRLIEDMFFLAKMDNKAQTVDFQTIDLGSFLEDYYYSALADPGFQNRDLKIDLSKAAPVSVRIDPELIRRVLDNLFSNALKYSGDGAEILLGYEQSGEEEVRVFVADTGTGIDPEDLPRIFERTFRSSKERSPKDGSSGLGLSIVKSIVSRHGGSVGCESESGKGSRFWFSLKTVSRNGS